MRTEFNTLVELMNRYDLYQKDDEVGIALNELEQKIIEEMRDLRRRGVSLRRISYWLDRIHGIEMSHSTVSTLL